MNLVGSTRILPQTRLTLRSKEEESTVLIKVVLEDELILNALDSVSELTLREGSKLLQRGILAMVHVWAAAVLRLEGVHVHVHVSVGYVQVHVRVQ